MKSSNRWAVMKSMDKSEEEIIKSFSEKKQKWLSLEGKDDTMTPLDSY
jgi:penicillin-binding protein 1A